MLVMHRQRCSYLSFLCVIDHFPAFSISIYPISTYMSAESGHCTNPWTMLLHVAQLFDTWAVFLECPEILCTSPNWKLPASLSLILTIQSFTLRKPPCPLFPPETSRRQTLTVSLHAISVTATTFFDPDWPVLCYIMEMGRVRVELRQIEDACY